MKLVAAFLALGLLIAGIALTFVFLRAQGASEQAHASLAGPEVWRSQIQNVGPDQAYEHMLATAAVLPAAEEHQVQHEFGKALYEELGADALPICVASPSDGCLHEIAALMLQGAGRTASADLAQVCKEHFTGDELVSCRHGIGHGLVHNLGLTQSGLNKALTLCDQVEKEDPELGCHGGVFMEFNTGEFGRVGLRSSPGESPYFPCEAVGSAEHASVCYFWLVQWQARNLSKDKLPTDATIARIGDYCEGAGREEDVRSCFKGLGFFVSFVTNIHMQATQEYCSVSSDVAAYRDICSRAGAHYVTSRTRNEEL
jgi:hypothetical protein